MVSLKINGNSVEVPEGSTILEAADKIGVHIPTLCRLDIPEFSLHNHGASCRVCMVEVAGRRNLAPACATPVMPDMDVKTHTARVINARRTVLELILSNHPKTCLTCPKSTACELQSLAAELSIQGIAFSGQTTRHTIDASSPAYVRDMNKCVLCRRCETMCSTVQTVNALSALNRGFATGVGPAFNMPIVDSVCVFCGQCVAVCPTAALSEVNNTAKVWDAIKDPDKFVVVQTAPAVRAALGEAFGIPSGVAVTGKMAAALRLFGFDKVFDTDFAADLTIMEEASEFIHRFKHGGKLPILTSCCPGWVKFFEHQFGDMLDVPSTCKSPQQMFGAVAKTWLAGELKVDPARMVVVSVMPCVAKKYEAGRKDMGRDGRPDVDVVITTRELVKMIREAGINFAALPDEAFDDPMGESTGAGVIFGASGGVLEAALRTAYEWITGKAPEPLDFTALRGLRGIKEAEIDIAGTPVKAAVAGGLGNARKLLEAVRAGKKQYHIIEIMACPGGCIDGGGQPYHRGRTDILKKRMKALYAEDKGKVLRKSHENPFIKKLYAEFLGEPYGKLAHELLHTHYMERPRM